MKKLSSLEKSKNKTVILVGLSKYVLGKLAGEEVPAIAIAFLEEGVENDEIIEIAGMHKPSMSEVEGLFVKAIAKIGISLPNVKEATIFLATQIAKQIIDGRISPYEGARKIWWELSNIDEADIRLKSFVGLASEYEDTRNESYRKDYEQLIIEEAHRLLIENQDLVLDWT